VHTVKIRRIAAVAVAGTLGILSLAACGSDRAGVSTAPTSLAAGAAAASAATAFHPQDHGGGNPGEGVEGEGVITGLKAGTSCPTLTFLIGVKSISVNEDTVYEHGSCDDLTIGKRVHVKGTMVGDDVVATRVHVQNDSPGHPVVEGDGRVTSLVGSTACPTLQFIAEEEWTVTVDANTVFVGGVCGDIAVGSRVGVKGTVTAEHEVLATKIVFKGPDNDN
jgi:predicted extracellular nuclease